MKRHATFALGFGLCALYWALATLLMVQVAQANGQWAAVTLFMALLALNFSIAALYGVYSLLHSGKNAPALPASGEDAAGKAGDGQAQAGDVAQGMADYVQRMGARKLAGLRAYRARAEATGSGRAGASD